MDNVSNRICTNYGVNAGEEDGCPKDTANGLGDQHSVRAIESPSANPDGGDLTWFSQDSKRPYIYTRI